jgi:plastocyanin
MLRARQLIVLACGAALAAVWWAGGGDAVAVTRAVEVSDFQFSPESLIAEPGDTIIFVLKSDAAGPHTVTSESGLFDEDLSDQQRSIGIRFLQKGSFPYHCKIHPQMVGTVEVVDTTVSSTTTTQPLMIPTTTTTRPTSTTTTTAPPSTPAKVGTGVVRVANPGPASTGPGGYWMLEQAGAVHGFGGATDLGSPFSPGGSTHVTSTKSGNGYWVLGATGRVDNFGDAVAYGSGSGLTGDETFTTMASTPTGRGYWLFTSRGRVFPFGDATFSGDMRGVALNGAVLDAVSTPSGRGYYMVASDGGIFTFGDASFRGSMGGRRLNKPVMSMAPDADGVGYWLVASDGGIFAFDAPFFGSTGSLRLNKPISGIVASPTGGGYLMVAQDGGIFSFGDVPFYGSLGSTPLASPVVSVAAFGARRGFSDGTYRVGADLAPGTYRTVGAPSGCYWARLNGLGGSLDEVNANSFGDGWAVVTIAQADRGFTTRGCGTWTHHLDPVISTPTFGTGTLIVGIDLAPGTYRGSGTDCYWARLGGFSGTLDEIAANHLSSGPQAVTITSTDAGFTSSNCGDWTKIG